jgi:hypothetical protein
MLGARPLQAEIAAARQLTGRPIAVNLLLPFARSADWEAAERADVVVTFWEHPGGAPRVSGSTSAVRSPRPSPRARPGPMP